MDVVLTAGAIRTVADPPIARAGSGLLCTDDRAQFEATGGRAPLGRLPSIHADLAELVTGRKPGRTHAAQRAMACNLGVALADAVAAVELHRRARSAGLGTLLPL